MAEMILNTSTLPEPLIRLIHTKRVRVNETGGIVQLMPISEDIDCTIGLRGMFSDFPEMSVDNFWNASARIKN
jgi:hypothetical protein